MPYTVEVLLSHLFQYQRCAVPCALYSAVVLFCVTEAARALFEGVRTFNLNHASISVALEIYLWGGGSNTWRESLVCELHFQVHTKQKICSR